MTTEAEKAAHKRYISSIAEIKVRVSKEQRDTYRAFAERKGMSLNKMIVEAIEKMMEEENMQIKGIGNINKKEVMSILTEEGKKAVREGDITKEELADMYKLQQIKRSSKIGDLQDTFNASYKWIPDVLKEKLSPEELGEIVDKFY